MADSKITALTALTAADPVNDMFPVVDVSDTSMAASGTTKRISVNNILSSSPTASGALTVTGLVTAGSATITGDLTVRTNKLAVTSTGVGCGTTTPANQLSVRNEGASGISVIDVRGGTGGAGALQISGNGTTLGTTSFDFIQNSAGAFILQRDSNPLDFSVNGATRCSIASNGVTTWSNVVTAGTAMTLNATGLGVGVSSASAKIHIANASMLIDTLSSQNKPSIILGSAGVNFGQIQNDGTGLWSLGYGASTAALGTPVLLWNSSGNVGIGVTPSGYRLHVRAAFTSAVGGAFIESGEFNQKGLVVNCTSTALSVNIVEFQREGTARLMLDSAGNLILQSSATPATLTTNGQLTVNATSNTNLQFSYRGSDGTTRVANITLA